MNKPIIAISPLFDPDTGFYHLRENYVKAVELAGGIPLILPLTVDRASLDTFLDLADGFLFAGGHDIQPGLYTDHDLQVSGTSCALRDEMELYLFKKIVERNLPALGICRGLQIFNVALGGDLFQDITHETSCPLRHTIAVQGEGSLPSDGTNFHEIILGVESELFRLFKKDRIMVNSFHHQAIKTPGRNVDVLARASDGIVEAIRIRQASWIVGVQWHPEVLFEQDPGQFCLFRELISQSEKRKLCKNCPWQQTELH